MDSLPPAPVHLAALRTAAAPVVAWYEGFLAGRPRPLTDLDTALWGLRALPPIGGRLGRAITLLATGGCQATSEEAVAAFETLRATAGLRPVEPPQPSPDAGHPVHQTPLVARARRGPRSWDQPPLPGLDEP